jgi:hypothetical protein
VPKHSEFRHVVVGTRHFGQMKTAPVYLVVPECHIEKFEVGKTITYGQKNQNGNITCRNKDFKIENIMKIDDEGQVLELVNTIGTKNGQRNNRYLWSLEGGTLIEPEGDSEAA